MVEVLKKRDYEFSPELLKPKGFELWAKVDSLGRKLIWQDSNYKISVDSYSHPTVFRLLTKATKGEKKIGELVCSEKTMFGKKYISLNYVNVFDEHKGAGYSFKMMNCLISMLSEDIEGIITNFDNRIDPKPVKKLFTSLGGFKNSFGYLEIKNPKRQ